MNEQRNWQELKAALNRSWQGGRMADMIVRLGVIRTIKQSVEVDLPPLYAMAKANHQKTVDFLFLIFGKVSIVTNTGKPMSELQMDATADLIINDSQLSQLTFSDVLLCINKGLSGYFGKLYNYVDTTVICDWLRRYREEKMKVKPEQEPVLQLEANYVQMPEYVKETIQGIMKSQEQRENEYSIHVNRELTETEKRHIGFIAEFDNLWRQNPNKGAIRTIEYNGKVLSCADFCELRMNEF